MVKHFMGTTQSLRTVDEELYDKYMSINIHFIQSVIQESILNI